MSVLKIKDTNGDIIYIEKINFENGWYKGFRNTDIRFTDSITYALKIKNKELAANLLRVCIVATHNKNASIETVDSTYIDKPKD